MQPMRMFYNNSEDNPFYRSIVGFDRMADLINSAVKGSQSGSGYPPYNIESLEDGCYLIELAVAGFSDEDLSLETRENTLVITGKKPETQPSEEQQEEARSRYLYRGIAERSFEKRFHLADHVTVANAELQNGLLSITLQHELPEALKPRTIRIQTKSKQKRTKKLEN